MRSSLGGALDARDSGTTRREPAASTGGSARPRLARRRASGPAVCSHASNGGRQKGERGAPGVAPVGSRSPWPSTGGAPPCARTGPPPSAVARRLRRRRRRGAARRRRGERVGDARLHKGPAYSAPRRKAAHRRDGLVIAGPVLGNRLCPQPRGGGDHGPRERLLTCGGGPPSAPGAPRPGGPRAAGGGFGLALRPSARPAAAGEGFVGGAAAAAGRRQRQRRDVLREELQRPANLERPAVQDLPDGRGAPLAAAARQHGLAHCKRDSRRGGRSDPGSGCRHPVLRSSVRLHGLGQRRHGRQTGGSTG
mmetsp:Transcript_93473/g.288339  ORF Transcript_93473/g.288339 Transcript_93473/m.288339 type:complete len:308 (+) Transcript_93473:125-1048(+)